MCNSYSIFISTKLRRLIFSGVFIFSGLCALSACSSDSDSGSVDKGGTESQGSLSEPPAAFLARSVINNGYYLSQSELFGSDGASFGGASYVLDPEENQIEVRELGSQEGIEALYTYDDVGDLLSVRYLSTSELLAPIGDDIQRVDVQRENGVLQKISVDYLVGNEEDFETEFMYDSAGRIASTITTYASTMAIETQQYAYVNDVLSAISGNDVEIPNVVVTDTIIRDAEGRVSLVNTMYEPAQPGLEVMNKTYIYDAAGNISEILYQDDGGRTTFREVFTYEVTNEPVFNLPFYRLYFTQ